MVNTRLRIFLCLDTERGDTEIQRGGRIQMIQREGRNAYDLIGVFSSWAIQIYNLVTQEY